MARISTTLPTRVYTEIGRIAMVEGRSMSNLMAFAIERYVDAYLEKHKDLKDVTLKKVA